MSPQFAGQVSSEQFEQALQLSLQLEPRLMPGQVTDDSELALSLANSIVESGKFDDDDIAFHYGQWYLSRPPDIGNTCRTAFSIVSLM